MGRSTQPGWTRQFRSAPLLIDNALMWLRDYHFDGLRLDAVHALFDSSAVHFLEQLASEVDNLSGHLGRTLVLIAESDLNDPRVVQNWDVGGYGLTAQWSDDFHHSLHACLTGERDGYYGDFGDIKQLQKALESGFVFDGQFSEYRNKFHGRPSAGVPGHKLVVCLQNHDQIGNRAQGERSSQLISQEGLLAGAAVLLTSSNVPMLFQGEEWGASTPFLYFTDHQDEKVACSVSEGRKNEFSAFGTWQGEVPDPQSPATFEKSKLNWTELSEEPHARILEWHRSLIELRRRMGGDLEVTTEAGSVVRLDRGSVRVVCDLNPQQPSVNVSLDGESILNSKVDQKQKKVEFLSASGYI